MIQKAVSLFIALIFLVPFFSASTTAASSKGVPAGCKHSHTWQQTDPPFVSAFSSGLCNEFGNPGTGRVCQECGITQEFLQSGDWVYTLLADGTVEIVRCDVNESEENLIAIPETVDGIPVTSVGDYAFRDGYNIGEIIIPEGITTIGDFAFDSCSNLKKVTIPSSVTLIGRNPFLGTKTEVALSSDNPLFVIVDNFLLEKQSKKLISCLAGDNNPVRSIPVGTEIIGDYAFSSNYLLSRVIIPDSVCAIGNHAFKYCNRLNEINIPDSVISIGDYSFENCRELTSIVIPKNVSSIGANPFLEAPVELQVSSFHPCFFLDDGVLFERATGRLISYPYNRKAADYSIPQGTREIGAYAFYCNSSLKQISIPEDVTVIGEGAFSNCVYLSQVSIPSTVTAINQSTFYFCPSLKELIIPYGVSIIEEYAFYSCQGLEKISIPDTVTTIGAFAFGHCFSLESVSIPTSVTEAGRSAFSGCIALQEVVIPGSMKQIEEGIFDSCEKLQTVTILDGVTEIGNYSFYHCIGLTKIILPNSIT